MFDSEDSYQRDANSTAREYEEQTASDTIDFTRLARAVRFGGGGNATLMDFAGNTTDFVNIQPGEVIQGVCRRVLATGLTASNIVALYS